MRHRFFTEHIRQFLAVSIAVQCLSALVFLYSYQALQNNARDNILQFAENYVEKVSEQLSWNNAYMEQSIVLSEDYRTLFLQNDMTKIDRMSELQITYRLLKETSMNEYNFFVCDKSRGDFVELTPVTVQFSQYRRIRPALVNSVNGGAKNGNWHLMETEGGQVITSLWTYGDFVLGCWIREADLLADLKTLDCGPNGGVSLLASDSEAEGENGRSGFGTSVTEYELERCEADFTIRVAISSDRGMTQIMLIQIVQFFFALQVMLTLILLIRQLRRNFIVPVKNLRDILGKYQSVLPHGENGQKQGAREAVEDAYEILDQLGARMENLAVELYESELEKKQLQLNFRNLQIRPHFFVNCLAMISGMAQVDAVDKIQQMTVCLSRYFRYILHDCMDMVPLRLEIDHMKNLILLNVEWNSGQISFDCQVEESVKDSLIPVLSVSTFLENSVKHAQESDGVLCIRLTARREGELLYLRVEDNGRGFPKELMEQLNQGAFVKEKDGKHIGINNVFQRFRLIYGKRARVLFSCPEGGGDCVELWIPVEMERK